MFRQIWYIRSFCLHLEQFQSWRKNFFKKINANSGSVVRSWVRSGGVRQFHLQNYSRSFTKDVLLRTTDRLLLFFSSYYFYSLRFFLLFICLKSHANEKTWCARRRFDWKTEKIVDIASSKKFQLYFASFPFMLLVSYIPKGLYNYDSLFYREKNCFLDCRFGDIVSFIRIFTWFLRRKEAILVIPHYYVEALVTLHRSTNC